MFFKLLSTLELKQKILMKLYINIMRGFQIWFFFDGIVKIIRAFKGLDNEGYDRKNMILTVRHLMTRMTKRSRID